MQDTRADPRRLVERQMVAQIDVMTQMAVANKECALYPAASPGRLPGRLEPFTAAVPRPMAGHKKGTKTTPSKVREQRPAKPVRIGGQARQ